LSLTLPQRFGGSLENPFKPANKSSPFAKDYEDHLLALYLSGAGYSGNTLDSVSAFFTDISSSLTSYVRQNGDAGLNDPAHGTVSVSTTCVRVQWGWVGYAGGTTLLLLIFFGSMVVQTRSAQVAPYHDFKSSALTLLYHGLEGESLDEAVGVGQRNSEWELDQMAKGVAVQLVHTDMGWKMRIVHPEGGKKECYDNY
jgi:hypothetical protein